MRTTLLVAALTLGCPASTCFAQVNVSWSGCPSIGAMDVADACEMPLTLYGTLQLSRPVLQFTGLDYWFEMVTLTPTLPNFWLRGAGECNGNPPIHAVHGYAPGSDPGCVESTALAGPGGAELAYSFVYWVSQWRGLADRAFLVGSIRRSEPVDLARGDYFVAKWTFSDANVASCPGCATGVAFEWEAVVLHRSVGDDVRMEGPGTYSNCATIGGPAGNLCGVTPVRSTTWGQIKSLYR